MVIKKYDLVLCITWQTI